MNSSKGQWSGKLSLFAAALACVMLADRAGVAGTDARDHRPSSGEKADGAARKVEDPPVAESAADQVAAGGEKELPTTDVLAGLRSGKLSATAEGTGDGRMTLSLKNRTNTKLRVVLPPGLIASGATGQFGGGMGGMGGMGGGMGMGGMGGGMGMGGMGGGMGGMGRGGMGMGGMGGRGMMGGGTMPASMGMMMLGRLIMSLTGDRDSWDQRSLMSGMMMGMGGMGMGGMGMGMGGMGMGGMGMRGGGFRSVPPTGPMETTLEPQQVRHLPTPVVSLNGPDAEARAVVPAKGERLRITGIDDWTDDERTKSALKRLAEAKAPRTVAQMALWYVTAGAGWDDVGRLSQGWGNASELALARRFVKDLDGALERDGASRTDPGILYWEIKTRETPVRELADDLRELWREYPVLGLTAKEDVPSRPGGPALACLVELADAAAGVTVKASHPSGDDWITLGTFRVKLAGLEAEGAEPKQKAARLGDAVAESLVQRLVLVQLARGPKVKGKDSYRVKVVNRSPMILNGLALGGREIPKDEKPTVLSGLSLPPLKSLVVGASVDVVDRLKLKDGVRVLAADLSGL